MLSASRINGAERGLRCILGIGNDCPDRLLSQDEDIFKGLELGKHLTLKVSGLRREGDLKIKISLSQKVPRLKRNFTRIRIHLNQKHKSKAVTKPGQLVELKTQRTGPLSRQDFEFNCMIN
ncbi:unnamed protein product [Dovyalis caffra]|uniref:Uncharacterized protein n=1 Tax=Dovyalis caffra TaxID=77055 RepID=A0AAV1RG47_9ROSI|nr:unnamed protein product [Dovyalis caffra]